MRRRGFTLIELLVVVSIIAVLASMLLSSIVTVKSAARLMQCTSNLRQVGMAALTYASDWQGAIPNTFNSNSTPYYWDANSMADYLPTSDRAWRCTSPLRWKATSASFPFVINWRLISNQVNTLGPNFSGRTQAYLQMVRKTGEAFIGADLSYGMTGGYHEDRSTILYADGRAVSHPDSSRRISYSQAVLTWADPGPTVWSEYGCQKSGAVKGWGY
ncbi:MAG: type II secretion system protein [Planctomycetes bacterium]|nr:type II secretion system protein [Planctomycetota bacterium]